MGINATCSSLVLAALLAGCTLGPNFAAPSLPSPASWFRKPAAPNEASQAEETRPPDPKWWSMLRDPELDRLVERVAKENPDVQIATARLEESRAERGIVAADLFPQLNGDASYTRQKLSDKGVISIVGGSGSGGGGQSGGSGGAQAGGIPATSATPPFNIYQYGFDASWEIDLWGRVRRGVEASDATLQASREARRATDLSVIAELVSDYVQLRGTQASLKIASDNLNVAQQLASLAVERERGGIGNALDVANAQVQSATIAAQLPPLQEREARLMNAIALLLGQPPGALEPELAAAQPVPPVPPEVPVGLPSELARRRPDIRQAEAQLHAATAQIGVAKADFFPQVTLMGNGALQALRWSDLNGWAARSYTFGPSISLPIFEGGRLKSTLQLRNDQQREAAITYRKTLLNAFHEVDNALTAFRTEQHRRKAILIAVEENQKALHLATERYRKGLSTFLDVLTAERSVLETQQQAIQSEQAESVNMVQLYKALGGGWETDFPGK